MNNKGKADMTFVALIVIAVIAIYVIGYSQICTSTGFCLMGPAKPVTPVVPPVVPPVNTGGACPATLATAYDGDVVNSLDSGAVSYIAAVHRFIPNNQFGSYIAFTSGTAAAGGTGVNLRCGESYKAYLLPAQDTHNPIAPIDFGVVTGSDASRVISAKNFSVLTSKGYDNQNHGSLWTNDNLAAAGTADALAATYRSTTNATDYTMAVGGTLDWTFDMQTTKGTSEFGNPEVGVYIAVDAQKSEYDTPLLQLGGVTLVDVKSSGELSADDLATLSTYEYVYKVPANIHLESAPVSARLYLQAKSGQNPSTDVVLRFLAKAPYVGNDGQTIYTDIFNRQSGSEIMTATAQTITITVG